MIEVKLSFSVTVGIYYWLNMVDVEFWRTAVKHVSAGYVNLNLLLLYKLIFVFLESFGMKIQSMENGL